MNTQRANADYDELRAQLDALTAETRSQESAAAVNEALNDTLVVLFARIVKILENLDLVMPVVNALRGEGMKLHHCTCHLQLLTLLC